MLHVTSAAPSNMQCISALSHALLHKITSSDSHSRCPALLYAIHSMTSVLKYNAAQLCIAAHHCQHGVVHSATHGRHL
jgi:hypothetical protein